VPETRCTHGFLGSVTPCPMGCHKDSPPRTSRKVPHSFPRKVSGRHSGFVDMTGQVCGTWKVLGEAPSNNGNTRWRCRHVCGGLAVLEGIRLRSSPPKFCDACRRTKRA